MAPGHPLHGPYHDTEYGFPAADERVLFERLMLEINQAGLSWLTILNKRAAFRAAFADFEVDRVAAFGPRRYRAPAGRSGDRAQPAQDRRGDRKCAARSRRCAKRTDRSLAGSTLHHPRPVEEWTRLFRQTFRFTGGQIVAEFLMSLGYLPGRARARLPGLGPDRRAVAALGALMRINSRQVGKLAFDGPGHFLLPRCWRLPRCDERGICPDATGKRGCRNDRNTGCRPGRCFAPHWRFA